MEQLTIQPPPSPEPVAVDWWIDPLSTGAHAFYRTSGFPRSVCRVVRWTVLFTRAEADDPVCPDCLAGVEVNRAAAS